MREIRRFIVFPHIWVSDRWRSARWLGLHYPLYASNNTKRSDEEANGAADVFEARQQRRNSLRYKVSDD